MKKWLILKPNSLMSQTVRTKTNAGTAKKAKKLSAYGHTLLMPKTELPLSMAAIVDTEKRMRKLFNHETLYQWQLNDETREETFVLHDGPPYANGRPHLGHALNKILKDIILRWKILKGLKVNYVPGWDCHGLPIELKALKDTKIDTKNSLSVRTLAHEFALNAVQDQKEAFKSWNILADWDGNKGCYYSMDLNFQFWQLDIFLKMFELGYIYQSFMPTYWSPSSHSALAESELEYKDDHISKSLYVKVPICKDENFSQLYALIWTTTPWTLPGNRAICFNPDLHYVVVRPEKNLITEIINLNISDELVVALESIDNIQTSLNCSLKIIRNINSLETLTYTHPLSKTLGFGARKFPFLKASHVSPKKGSGLVHTAPAHGHDDFHVFRSYGLDIDESWVDSNGRFKTQAAQTVEGPLSTKRAGIVMMSSNLGSITNTQIFKSTAYTMYNSSKAGLNMVMKCLALEYEKDGILVFIQAGFKLIWEVCKLL